MTGVIGRLLQAIVSHSSQWQKPTPIARRIRTHRKHDTYMPQSPEAAPELNGQGYELHPI